MNTPLSVNAYDYLVDLLKDLPEGVDLTLVGGSALAHYLHFYRAFYPEDFEERLSAATKDLDFIGHRDAARACAKHWGGKLTEPGPDNHTPELAILEIERNGETLHIDFLHDLLGISKREIDKGRVPMGHSKSLYLLSEPLVLTNRVMNAVRLTSFGDHPRQQLQLAKSIVTCAIKAAVESGNPTLGSRIAKPVISLSLSRDGLDFTYRYEIPIIDCIPLGIGLPPAFETHNVASAKTRIEQKLHERRRRDKERSR